MARRQVDGAAAPLPPRAAQEALEEADKKQQACRKMRDHALASVKKAEAAHQALAMSMREMEQEIRTLDAQLAFLREREGDDLARAQAIQEALSQQTTADSLLLATRQTLARHEPEHLAADRARFERAWNEQSAKKAAAHDRRTTAAALLRNDGGSDPAATLALAQARHQAAQSHRQSVERQARAVRRVHELMLQEQRSLADQFTRPLADRVGGYLQRLFGQDVQVQVTLQNHEFQGLTLSRDGQGAFPFASLSVGAREQMAAAFRLALAEILAESHDGSLPVVFDDAFAHSDPDRVQHLQRMLDLAASRGLQIILLTCTPGDYAMMGAKEVRLG